MASSKRSDTSATDSNTNKRPRRTIDLEFKQNVIRQHEGGKRVNALARELGVSQSTITTILKNKDEILQNVRGESAPTKWFTAFTHFKKRYSMQSLKPEPSHEGPSKIGYLDKPGIPRTENTSATVSSLDPLSRPTNAKFQKKMGRQLENQFFEKKEQKAMTHSVQPSLSPGTQMQVQHHLQVAAPLPASSQPPPRQVQMVAIPVQVKVAKPKPIENRKQKAMTHSVQPSLSPGTQMQVQHHLQAAAPLPASSQSSRGQEQMVAIPVQVKVAKPKPVENRKQKAMTLSVKPSHPAGIQMRIQQHSQAAASTQTATRRVRVQVLASPPPVPVTVPNPKPIEKPQKKRLLVVASHQHFVMSSLASLWKRGKLCDASIGNGSSTVMVHKLVLSAVCPKLLSVSNMDTMSHEFLQVNFPETVGKEALNAFGEYMYNGILNLNCDILKQLKIIAKRLDMKEFERLCNSHLPEYMEQPVSTADKFTNVPSIQKTLPIPASLGSTISTSMQSVPSVTTQVIKQEITDAEQAGMFSQKSELPSLAPNKSGHPSGSVISPIIKTEMVGPEDDKYGHWSSNQTFTSTNSSFISSSNTATVTVSTSIASAPESSTEFANPFSERTGVKSTRLKASHSYEAPLVSDLSPASGIVETVRSQSNSMNEDPFKPLSQPLDSLSSVNLSNSNDTVYPVRLFSARGDNLPLLTTHSSDAMTVNSFIKNEKT